MKRNLSGTPFLYTNLRCTLNDLLNELCKEENLSFVPYENVKHTKLDRFWISHILNSKSDFILKSNLFFWNLNATLTYYWNRHCQLTFTDSALDKTRSTPNIFWNLNQILFLLSEKLLMQTVEIHWTYLRSSNGYHDVIWMP